MQSSSSAVAPSQPVSILAVSPHAEDHRTLTHLIRHTNWELHHAYDAHEAADLLSVTPVSVVLCEYRMPGGGWVEVVSRASELPAPPVVIVTSAHADDCMWAEVLNEGGYDCLLKPFRAEEVYRTVSLAWRSWRDHQYLGQSRAVATATA